MKQMDLIKGQIYRVIHVKKGTFSLRVMFHDKIWVTGVIVQGRAKAYLNYFEKGEQITIRKEFSIFYPITLN